MLDVILASKLVRAIPAGAHLLLAGDVDQLPSVGAGEVLRDLLAAGAIPRVRLTEIFRQARQSGIVVNAHRINHGQPPQLAGFPDFYWLAGQPDGTVRSGLGPAPAGRCRGGTKLGRDVAAAARRGQEQCHRPSLYSPEMRLPGHRRTTTEPDR
jgi:hypothetical protein